MNTARNCPQCGARLAVRRRRKDGKKFLGCTRYPDCKHTEPYPEEMKMRAEGQPELWTQA